MSQFDTQPENSEVPPSLKYSIAIASPPQVQQIIQKLKSMNRQTMNLRNMANVEVLILRDDEKNQKIVGWQGLGIHSEYDIPEKFSLHLDTEYRSFLLGLALETVYYKYLRQRGYNYAMARMDVKATPSLKDYRMTVGVFVPVAKSEMPPRWQDMCSGCELFNKSCVQQVYFKCDVEKGVAFGEQRLGLINALAFPYQVELVEHKIRKAGRKYVPSWAA